MRERLLNQATTRRGGKEGEGERRMGALKTEPSLASVGEGRQKKPFLFSVVSLSLSHSRFCSTLFAVRSSPFFLPLLVAFVISSSRRPVSIPRRTLNWQSAFEGVNIVLLEEGGREGASFSKEAAEAENNLEKSRSLSLSVLEI